MTPADDITVDAVAERARTSKTAIYRRWHSRDDLMEDVVRHASQHLVATETRANDLRGALTEILDQWMRDFTTDPSITGLGRLMLVQAPRPFVHLASECLAGYLTARLDIAFRRAARSGDTRLIADLFMGVTIMRERLAILPERTIYVDRVVDLVLTGTGYSTGRPPQ
jgi:AcrR family transcriptional regulator